VDQHERPLALPQVAELLLAVAAGVRHEIEDVVADLEGGAQVEAEVDHRLQVRRPPRPDERSEAQRQDRRVPAGLLHDELEVVGRAEVEPVVLPPAELERLAVDGLGAHELELGHHPLGHAGPEAGNVVPERGQCQQGQSVPGVERERRAVGAMEGGLPAAQLARVLDVVVHEERVVQRLEGDC
jgi:hypothetical protein